MAIVRLIIRRQVEDNPGSGFRVTLDARDFNRDDIEGTLPPLPSSLMRDLDEWKRAYSCQEEVRSHYRIAAGAVVSRSIQDITNLADSLEQGFNSWLLSADPGWVRIREVLATISRQSNEEPRIIIDLGNNNDLKRLPWQDWELLAFHYQSADAALRLFADTRQRPPEQLYPKSSKIRILIVVGESTGISTSQDLECVTRLAAENPAKVEVVPLLQPTRLELQTALEAPQGYHIFIYVGHSRSREDGQIGWLLLNEEDEISIRDFRRALKQSVNKGLQLIILNSCDGLGLSQQLANLDAPRCVVMKEPIPDAVAVEFIDRFFRHFAKEGQPLQTSIRKARQGLEAFNGRYSEVTWLPTVCIKQNAQPLTWKTLLDNLQPEVKRRPVLQWVKLAAGAVAALALMGVVAAAAPGLRERFFAGNGVGTTAPEPTISPARLVSAGGNANFEGIPPLSEPYAQLKREGIAAFAAGEYAQARDLFDQIRADAKAQRQVLINDDQSQGFKDAEAALKDPEVLIFRNNAEVRLRHEAGEPTYTIAAAVPLTDRTGAAFNIGREMLFGIAQAQDHAVSRAADAVNLEVVIANDRNDPSHAVAVAKALAQGDLGGRPVLAVVGHYTSESTCKALESVYNEARLVVVSPLSTLVDLRRGCGGSTVFFRTTSSTQIETQTLIAHLDRSGYGNPGSTAAIFYRQGEAYSDDMAKEFRQQLNNRSIGIAATFDLSESNFNAAEALESVRGVDALVVIPDGRSSSSSAFENALAVIKANAGEKIILGSNPLYNSEIINPAGGLANLTNRLFVATDWHSQCAPDAFVKEVSEEYWFGGVNRTAALPYEAVQVLLPTLQPGVTSEQIRQRLSQLDNGNGAPVVSRIFEGNKTISFDDVGDRLELQQRILTTVGDNPSNPFVVVDGECP
jgi:ABC-type branched-subunit amino acid transport system substrate-binding protein